MLEKDFTVKVSNRDNSYVGYTVPELNNLHRRFAPGETKEITMDELRKLSWTPGGTSLIKNHLIVHNEEAVAELVPDAEPEYFYNAEDIKTLLIKGSLDQVKDALDFAPEGVISLIKDTAVSEEINDVYKRDAIKESTGFDVTRAIENNKASQEEGATEVKARRATPLATTEVSYETPQRRTAAYSIKKN